MSLVPAGQRLTIGENLCHKALAAQTWTCSCEIWGKRALGNFRLSAGRLPLLNTNSSLVGELKDKQYRDAYVASQIRMSLPVQIRELRKSRDMTQPQLAQLSGMTQPRISEIERPGERRLNIETLLRIASAFDVALQIKFVPFEELIDWGEGVDLDHFSVIPFTEELRLAEESQLPQAELGSPAPCMQAQAGWEISESAALTLPWVHAKYLRDLLSGVIEAYEKVNGKITIPVMPGPPDIPDTFTR